MVGDRSYIVVVGGGRSPERVGVSMQVLAGNLSIGLSRSVPVEAEETAIESMSYLAQKIIDRAASLGE
ncbi:hypothetical protein [Arthrobacter sp. VKM Ac-2550]|uniref:hypothetical protein n=1 Tax=Crystallibacter permensis TaxID=1938888 RepID=UPI0022264BC2|nr:hypothetical protein [Arthrobacter sp. VKM Ac-2550]